MKFNRALPLFWMPILAFWSFLISIHINSSNLALEDLVTTIIYCLVSFLLVLQLQLILGGSNEGAFVKFGSINIISICLLVSSLTILLSITGLIGIEYSIILLIGSLLLNTILAELLSYSTKKIGTQISKERQAWANRTSRLDNQQKKASIESSKERRQAIELRDEWENYLKDASTKYLLNSFIIDEISRIKDILQYSSYFRYTSSIATLSKLKHSDDEDFILRTLRDIN